MLAVGSIVAALAVLLAGCGAKEPAPQADPLRISCVGDSITYGFGLADRAEECWVSLVADALPEGSRVANFGVSGACVRADGHYPWEETLRAVEFWEVEEEIVIVMLGTNDVCDAAWSAEVFERDYRELVEKIRAKPGAPQVIVMLPPAIHASSEADARLADEAIPALERVAQHAGACIVDLHALTADHPEWFDDGLHPNAEGNAAIAAAVEEALRSCRRDA